MRFGQTAHPWGLLSFLLVMSITSVIAENATPLLTVAGGQMQVTTTTGFVVDGWDIVATLSHMLAEAAALNASTAAQQLAAASRLERLETRVDAQAADIISLRMLATSLQTNLTATAERETQLEAKVHDLTAQLAAAINHQTLLQEHIANLTNGTEQRLDTLAQEVDAATDTATGAQYNISFLQETIKTFNGELERIDEALEQVGADTRVEEVFIDAGSGYAQLYDNDAWHTLQLSVKLPSVPAVTVWRNRLVSAGGGGSSAVFAISATGAASRLPDLPRVVASAAAATFRDKIFVVGGVPDNDNGQNRLRSVYMFDGISWRTGPSLNGAGRAGISCAPFQDELVCVGGYYYINSRVRWSSVTTVEIYDGSAWRYGPSLPRPTSQVGLVAYQESLYIFGGLDHENVYSYYNSILRLDDLNKGWTQLALTLSTPRAVNSATIFRGEVLLVGGFNGPSDHTGLLKIVESFNGTALTRRPNLMHATFLSEGGVLKTKAFA
ncbi:uncharacterized protein MONBRDRAFT_34130 [Monosiga brevicollis MX1]|uniref:Uncharacterized protein n=1 Tax=Monosiga brevicollis TaxID=81824 RepID=A9V9R6_MONBE|nr:uncharacterized protein MONBRDRAFT_34130 [Monosiga brevicollis MX1]EDQ85713.1 predicted protein [Monosiga brevicollis MX1]|eukprot:XP_001749428.1 hypothetical protein [Monosiga brevicollis MX1]